MHVWYITHYTRTFSYTIFFKARLDGIEVDSNDPRLNITSVLGLGKMRHTGTHKQGLHRLLFYRI